MKDSFFKKFILTFLKFFVIFGILGAAVTLGAIYYISTNVENIDYNAISLNFSSVIYCKDEKNNDVEYEQIYGEQNRLWCGIDDMNEYLPNAFVAIEDERFYKHSGFDAPRTIKAVFNYVLRKDSSFGGSTINQQLVKNITGDDETTAKRKVVEIFRAIDMDKKLSKEQILELYLNTIYLSQGCYGVETASNKYFGKPVSELDLAESACIAGITQYPTKFDPVLNPENNKQKRKLVLSKMLELNMISQSEYDEAVNEELVIQNNAVGLEKQTDTQSFFADQVINDVIADLQTELKVSKAVATKMIYGGGLEIYSTVDKKIQEQIDSVFENPSKYISYNEKNPIQAAIVIMDPYTGEIKGISGGLGDKGGIRTLNRASQSPRQPGSTIKPLSVYAPGFEYKKFTPNTVMKDEVYKVGEHTFKNYYKGYRGNMTVRRAIEESVNTIAVKCLEKVGIDISYSFMVNNLHISSLSTKDKSLSPLALGGLTNGISVVEMTAAYSSFVNEGSYSKPHTYTKVVDSTGKVILKKEGGHSEAMSEETAATTVKALRGVVSNGTGFGAQLPNGIQTAGKTGTTDDDKDRWFMGLSPYYVAGVWVGYDSPQTITGYAANPALTLWKACMTPIHQSLKYKAFNSKQASEPVASETHGVKICMDSGKLATELCEKDMRGSRVSTVNLPESEVPKEKCTLHQYVKIDKTTNKLAKTTCPLENVEVVVLPKNYITEECDKH